MFFGSLADSARYRAQLPQAIGRALDALADKDLAAMPAGRYEIDGDRLLLLVQDVMLRPQPECRPEAHRTYADVQIPVSGCERYGAALPQAGLVPEEDLLASRDVAFYPAPANEFFVDLDPGSFAVFFPGELHRPCVAIDGQQPLRKIVLKVHAGLLGLDPEQVQK